MNNIKFTISETSKRNAERDIKTFATKITTGVEKEIFKAAVNIRNKAILVVPVDTGRLRSSVEIDFFKSEPSATIGSDVTYAYPVEMKNRAFLFPAYESEKPIFRKALKKALRAQR